MSAISAAVVQLMSCSICALSITFNIITVTCLSHFFHATLLLLSQARWSQSHLLLSTTPLLQKWTASETSRNGSCHQLNSPPLLSLCALPYYPLSLLFLWHSQPEVCCLISGLYIRSNCSLISTGSNQTELQSSFSGVKHMLCIL